MWDVFCKASEFEKSFALNFRIFQFWNSFFSSFSSSVPIFCDLKWERLEYYISLHPTLQFSKKIFDLKNHDEILSFVRLEKSRRNFVLCSIRKIMTILFFVRKSYCSEFSNNSILKFSHDEILSSVRIEKSRRSFVFCSIWKSSSGNFVV